MNVPTAAKLSQVCKPALVKCRSDSIARKPGARRGGEAIFPFQGSAGSCCKVEENFAKYSEAILRDPNENEDLARKRYQKLMITHEIYQTELEYVKNVTILTNKFILPLEEENHPILKDAQIAVFFNDIKQLLTLNSNLCQDLHLLLHSEQFISAKNCGRPEPESVGSIFCKYAPLFMLYASYAMHFDDVSRLFQESKRDGSSGFEDFLSRCESGSGTSLPFESLLILPIQRIPRYKLLLERLLSYGNEDYLEDKHLIDAVSKVCEAATFINETIRNHENFETLMETQAKFGGSLSYLKNTKKLIRHGRLLKVSRKRPEEVIIHLFNDLLVYSDRLATGGYRLRRTISLKSKSCKVSAGLSQSSCSGLVFDGHSLCASNGFTISSSEKSFMLFASSVEERRSWAISIREAIKVAQDEANVSASNGSELLIDDEPAALWVPDRAADCCSQCKSAFSLLFRRHHCRRCGLVVCGYCSEKRTIMFSGNADNHKEKRVCIRCYRIVEIVKRAAMKWRSLLIRQRGWLRRKRWHKWSRYYFELRNGSLHQYSTSPELRNAKSLPYDELPLINAMVLRRSERSAKKFCFQVTTPDCKERLGESILDKRASLENIFYNPSFTESNLIEPRVSSFDSNSSGVPETGWVLLANSAEEELTWVDAIRKCTEKNRQRDKRSKSLDINTLDVAEDRNSLSDRFSGQISLEECRSPNAMLRAEQKRYYILQEIVRSEKIYVDSLGECINTFVRPLLVHHNACQQMTKRSRGSKDLRSIRRIRSCNTAMLSDASTLGSFRSFSVSSRKHSAKLELRPGQSFVLDADMAVFFNCLEQIFTLNQQLKDNLLKHLDETSVHDDYGVSAHRVGTIFNDYAPLFNLYTAYASRHEASLNAIRGQEFQAFLHEMPKGATLHRLRLYLNMPMDRIPRYKVLLQELWSCMPESHPDYVPLKSAIDTVNLVVASIDENIIKREFAERLLKLERAYSISLKGKRIVLEGTLRKSCRRSEKMYHFVLLNDTLLYGHRNGTSTYKLHRLIDLHDCRVVERSNVGEETPESLKNFSQNSFYFMSHSKSFAVSASSAAECRKWVQKLRACIESTNFIVSKRKNCKYLTSSCGSDNNDKSYHQAVGEDTVLKRGWLSGVDPMENLVNRKWLSLSQQVLTISSKYESPKPDAILHVENCQIVCLNDNLNGFKIICSSSDTPQNAINCEPERPLEFTFFADTLTECKQWIKVFSYCVSGNDGGYMQDIRPNGTMEKKFAPIYASNKSTRCCMLCSISFTIYRRRHHCRNCGRLVCGTCSKNKRDLEHINGGKRSRICDDCVKGLKLARASPAIDILNATSTA